MLGMSHRAAIRTSLFRVKPRPVTNSDANNHETRDARIFIFCVQRRGIFRPP